MFLLTGEAEDIFAKTCYFIVIISHGYTTYDHYWLLNFRKNEKTNSPY